MRVNRKFTVIGLLVTGVTICAAAGSPKPSGPIYKNLKVLPKDISSKDLQGIMTDDFEDGLGVTCGFCHANAKDGHGLDFVSDAKPEKGIARSMMAMTLKLNKKFFNIKHPLLGGSSLIITCSTCHRGEAFPDAGAASK
jgi:hypothetical protein